MAVTLHTRKPRREVQHGGRQDDYSSSPSTKMIRNFMALMALFQILLLCGTHTRILKGTDVTIDTPLLSNATAPNRTVQQPPSTSSTPTTESPSVLIGPNYFSQDLRRTLKQRGLNVITPESGCHLTAWIFRSEPVKEIRKGHFYDCNHSHPSQILTRERVSKIRANDTVYVPMVGLTDFVDTILPAISTSIVLLAGQFKLRKGSASHIKARVFVSILDSPHVVKLFAHNIDHFLPLPELQKHPKLAPWAFGIEHFKFIRPHDPPLPYFERAFWRNLDTIKTKGIMRGYISRFTNREVRQDVPVDHEKLSPDEYYDTLAQHRFVLSPSGDRPECYRHYEALGMGAIPITGLPSPLYYHLEPGPVLYNTGNWSLDEVEALRRLNRTDFPTVQRVMVTEEYWVEYVERQIGGDRKLRWFDRLAMKQARLEDFYLNLTNGSGVVEH